MARPARAALPIDPAMPELIEALRARGAAVLVAPPGSGKTTRAPVALLEAGLIGAGKLVLLQPRRVAARLAARRIAEELGVAVGAEVGYQVRFDDRTSASTRIEVVTEGLLTRRLGHDPLLSGVDMVILDEFHERSLHTDLGLALLAALRRELRPELRLLVMSATLEPGPVQRFLADAAGPAPLIRAEGRAYPVALRYLDRPLSQRLDLAVAQAVRAEAPRAEGHTLVFLPGVGEIDRVKAILDEHPPADQPRVLPLHGRLRPEEQDAALSPSAAKKIVLSTNIAETSVTLEGVTLVIDAGLERRPVADPATGLVRLETQPIGRDSADQRAGRAGRTGPGACLRLWTEAEQPLRPASAPAAIHEEDLAGTLLLLLELGEDPTRFGFFERPTPGALAGAMATLRAIGAIDAGGITALGRAIHRLPTHPRFGAVVVEGRAQGCLRAAAAAAALCAERDPWPDQADRLDLLERVALLDQPARRSGAHPGAHRECAAVRDQLIAVAGGGGADRGGPDLEDRVIKAILAGFPERLARRREGALGRLLLANGSGAVLDPPEQVPGAELLVAVVLQAGRRGLHSEHRVRLAAPVAPGLLPTQRALEARWDEERRAAVVVERRVIGGLVLSERVAPELQPEPAAAAALLEAAARRRPDRGLDLARLGALRGRLRLIQRHLPELGLPAVDPEGLDALLPGLCMGRRSLDELARIDVEQAILGHLSWKLRAEVEAQAPTHLVVPSGASLPLDYGDGEAPPVLAARIQQLFGLRETPRVCSGRAPVRLHLLAPNGRPQQVTQDLMSFWREGYPEVRKELRGRYPKHPWPDDPLSATPVDRARRRSDG